MTPTPDPNRDASTIFNLALVFLALALVLFLSSAAVPINSELAHTITAAAIVAATAGATLGLWGGLKLLLTSLLLTRLIRLLRKFGLEHIFTARRLALHLSLAALLTAGSHYYNLRDAYAYAEAGAKRARESSSYLRNIPPNVGYSGAGIYEVRPGQEPLTIKFERFRDVQENSYGSITRNHFHKLFAADARASGLTDAAAWEQLADARRKDIQWKTVDDQSLPELAKAFSKYSYLQIHRGTLDHAILPEFEKGDAVSLRNIDFSFDSRGMKDIAHYFIESDKLFINYGDRIYWVFSPAKAIYICRDYAQYRNNSFGTSFFSNSLFKPILYRALFILALLAPFLYLRRYNPKAPPSDPQP